MSIHTSFRAAEQFRTVFNPHQEEVWVLALNSELLKLSIGLIFRGSVDCCQIHPREIFRFLVETKASSWVLSHNHPTGSCLPSRADLLMTRRLIKLGRLIEIPLVDHLILDSKSYCSLADRGFFKTVSTSRAPLA